MKLALSCLLQPSGIAYVHSVYCKIPSLAPKTSFYPHFTALLLGGAGRLTVEKKGKIAATANEIKMPHVLTNPQANQPGLCKRLSGLQTDFNA